MEPSGSLPAAQGYNTDKKAGRQRPGRYKSTGPRPQLPGRPPQR